MTTELALAAFAAETGGHVVSEPRDARYARFVERFDEAAFTQRLAASGIRWLARSDPAFPLASAVALRPAAGALPPGCGRRSAARAACSRDRRRAGVLGLRRARRPHVRPGAGRGRPGRRQRDGTRSRRRGSPRRARGSGGTTVAVLGCGIDRDYPAAHAELARRIAADGLVVSEYAPGVEPAPWRFPARNRIVAGLAQATVVVEARERSGALITADLALEEGREVFAVPGEITSALSAGAERPAATRRHGGDVGRRRARVVRAAPARSRGAGALTAGEARARPPCESPASADQLARALDLDAGSVAAALAELELHGLLTETSGIFRAAANDVRVRTSRPRRSSPRRSRPRPPPRPRSAAREHEKHERLDRVARDGRAPPRLRRRGRRQRVHEGVRLERA